MKAWLLANKRYALSIVTAGIAFGMMLFGAVLEWINYEVVKRTVIGGGPSRPWDQAIETAYISNRDYIEPTITLLLVAWIIWGFPYLLVRIDEPASNVMLRRLRIGLLPICQMLTLVAIGMFVVFMVVGFAGWQLGPRISTRSEHLSLSATFLIMVWPLYHLSNLWYRKVHGILERRLSEQVCEKCGYDLRGTASHAPCPECGQVGEVSE